jgi:hypothetical protein
MVLLARSGTEHPLTLPEFGVREGVSTPYAGKLLMIEWRLCPGNPPGRDFIKAGF